MLMIVTKIGGSKQMVAEFLHPRKKDFLTIFPVDSKNATVNGTSSIGIINVSLYC